MNLIATGVPRVAVEANWGRWISKCMRCPSALRVTPFTPYVECRECGSPAELVWPEADLLEGIERLLMMRPNVVTRNWTSGEDLHDLLQESIEHGVITADVGDVLAIVGDRIIRDTLPASPELRRIGA